MNATGQPEKNFDVIVVGNGVLGLSLGLVLARRGQDVAVLGKPHRPFAGTTASGACSAPSARSRPRRPASRPRR